MWLANSKFGPCRAEQPDLQKLIEQNENRSDVQFLTHSIDDNPGLTGPFMQKHKLTFTVLAARNYVEDTLKVFSVPQNWLVDANGVVRVKGSGYDDAEKWAKSMTEAIHKYAPAATAAAPGGSGR